MNEQQIKILIDLLENIERGQKNAQGELKSLKEQISTNENKNAPIRLNFEPLFERLERNKKEIISETQNLHKKSFPLIEKKGENNDRLFGFLGGLILMLIVCFLCFKYKLEPDTRAETISRAVEFYTFKNKKEALSIDSISNSIRPQLYQSVVKSIKRKK